MFPPTSHPLIWDYIYWYGSTDLCHHCLPRTEFTSKMSPPPQGEHFTANILQQLPVLHVRTNAADLQLQVEFSTDQVHCKVNRTPVSPENKIYLSHCVQNCK